jgi:hypothetical protein
MVILVVQIRFLGNDFCVRGAAEFKFRGVVKEKMLGK